MPERCDRSRSPKPVGGESDVAWPGLVASLDRVHASLRALLARGEAEADYLSKTQRVQLKQHLDRIAEDAVQLAQPKQEEDEITSKPAQHGEVNLNRTKSQEIGQKRIDHVRSQFNECKVPMTNLVRSVSLLIKDPVPSDVEQLREALTKVERSQKEARNYGEDLLQFMLDLDNISGLLDEDRNIRRSTMRGIDALLANIDEARGRLVSLHRILKNEVKNRQEQQSLSSRDNDRVQCTELESACQRGGIASGEPKFKDAAQPQETKPEAPEIDVHPALLERASLKRTSSALSVAFDAPDEHQVPGSKLARLASRIQEADTLLRNIQKAETELMRQETVPSECANVDRGYDAALSLQECMSMASPPVEEKLEVEKLRMRACDVFLEASRSGFLRQALEEIMEERKKGAKEEHRIPEAGEKSLTSTQPLLIPSGAPTTFAPRSAESYARLAF